MLRSDSSLGMVEELDLNSEMDSKADAIRLKENLLSFWVLLSRLLGDCAAASMLAIFLFVSYLYNLIWVLWFSQVVFTFVGSIFGLIN